MAACALLLTPMAMAADSAVHELPYDSYVFSADGTPLELPAPFVPQQIVTGAGLGVGGFQGLSDIFCGSDGLLVLADAGNNRLILTDTAWNAPVVLASFDNGGRQDAFNNPTGVYVRGNDLYVADAGNARILLFDRATLTLRRELSRPSIPSLGEDYTYKPLKLTADAAGRVYVVAEGINQGLIELNETGAFSTFLGAPSVTPDFFELIWRKFATKEQLAQLEKYVPTEYDAVTIDSDGFLFAVSKNAENTPIAKLNNQGNNVLLFPQKLGDAEFYENKPYFTDLALDERGIVFLLDSKQGKIYAYTQEGDLLFAFGANATQQGCFYSASAMELANGLLYVCDSNKNTVTILEPTAFGAAVVDATILEEQGRYEDAYAHWREVSRRCSHYAPAEVGIAQEEIRQGRYADAMSRLKAIREEDVYATAFEKGRNEWIRNHFLPLLGGAAALILLLLLVPRLVKKWAPVQRLRAAPLVRKFRYATYSAFLLGYQTGGPGRHEIRPAHSGNFHCLLRRARPVQRLLRHRYGEQRGQCAVRMPHDPPAPGLLCRGQLVFYHPHGRRRKPQRYLHRLLHRFETLPAVQHPPVSLFTPAYPERGRVLSDGGRPVLDLGGGPAVPRHDDDPRLFFVQGSSGHAAHHRGHLLDYLHRPAVHQRGAGRGVLLPGYLHRSVLPILLKEASS